LKIANWKLENEKAGKRRAMGLSGGGGGGQGRELEIEDWKTKKRENEKSRDCVLEFTICNLQSAISNWTRSRPVPLPGLGQGSQKLKIENWKLKIGRGAEAAHA
jgi:hypothetical protein